MVLTIDRMELDDAGCNPIKLASALFQQLPDIALPVPIIEIATSVEIKKISFCDIKNFDGALITTDGKPDGIIVVNENSPESRQRFTIAHELGHYLLPHHTVGRFECTRDDMMRTEQRSRLSPVQKMEVEANAFAAEILMPRLKVSNYLRRKTGADIEHILELAEKYAVSKESMARRYIDLQSEPCCIIFLHKNRVRYSYRNNDFPFLPLKPTDMLPASSGTRNASILNQTNWHETDSDDWGIDSSVELCEQSYVMPNGYKMSLLSLDEADTEEIGSYPWNPRF